MQRMPSWSGGMGVAASGPLILLFERNDAVAVPLLAQLRTAGYDVRAARIPVEVFDLLQREPVELILVDLGNAAANRREFWVGLDSQRRGRAVQVLTFRYLATGDTGDLETGMRVARADVEIISAHGFGPLIEAVRARLPGALPVPQWNGVPPNMAPPPMPGQPPPGNPSLPLRSGPSAPASAADQSPFAHHYSDNPFKRRPGGMPPGAPTPAQPGMSAPPGMPPASPAYQPAPPSAPWGVNGHAPPANGHAPPATGSSDAYAGFGGAPATPARPAPFNDAWTPPPPPDPPRRGAAYRGYDDEPLAPDDPRIEDSTSPIPAVAYEDDGGAQRNERALSTILMDSAVLAPQRIDALRAIQQTLAAIGMNFTLSDLAMLFKFLTPDQLLAAYLVSRGLVSPEQIATLGRIKQESRALNKDYDLEALLIMHNILPADEIRRLRSELG